jgi:predicted  nucleic acid-binding Zn-ribbon protein
MAAMETAVETIARASSAEAAAVASSKAVDELKRDVLDLKRRVEQLSSSFEELLKRHTKTHLQVVELMDVVKDLTDQLTKDREPTTTTSRAHEVPPMAFERIHENQFVLR